MATDTGLVAWPKQARTYRADGSGRAAQVASGQQLEGERDCRYSEKTRYAVKAVNANASEWQVVASPLPVASTSTPAAGPSSPGSSPCSGWHSYLLQIQLQCIMVMRRLSVPSATAGRLARTAALQPHKPTIRCGDGLSVRSERSSPREERARGDSQSWFSAYQAPRWMLQGLDHPGGRAQ